MDGMLGEMRKRREEGDLGEQRGSVLAQGHQKAEGDI